MAEFVKAAGKVAIRAALVNVGVPSTYVYKTDAVTVFHQAGDAPGFQLKALAGHGMAVGTFHLDFHVLHDLVAHGEAFVHGGRQRRVAVHRRDDAALAVVHRRFRNRFQCSVGYRGVALKNQR